jgi:ribosomal protein L37AE/L43A
MNLVETPVAMRYGGFCRKETKNMSILENRVCPWIGCGGTILRKESRNPEAGGIWVCDCCGESFASLDDYKQKLEKENSWAESWIEWGRHSRTVKSAATEEGFVVESEEKEIIEPEAVSTH